MADILSSPYTYILMFVAALGGYYAKGTIIDAVIIGGLAPLILAPVWFVAMLATTIFSQPVHFIAPDLLPAIADATASWHPLIRFVVSIPTIVTAALFALYCHSEREGRDLPSGYTSRTPQTFDHNPFSRPLRR
jgi:hypothetical protein